MTAMLDHASPAALSTVAEPVAELRAVSVHRGGATLLRDIDWVVRSGERWVVLGANGAGKTTLLQVLAGTVAPDAGHVELLGERLDGDEVDLDDLLPRVGYSSAALADRLGARERVLDVVVTAGVAATTRRPADGLDERDEARARQLLVQVGCRQLVDRELGSLSEGERKRVQLARAVMTDPELLLLDEPAAGLDLGGREALLRLLARLAVDRRAPVQVLVSHHVEEIPAGFTHALLLREGTMVAAGPVSEVLSSAGLSRAFGLPLRVLAHDGRWTARLAVPRRG